MCISFFAVYINMAHIQKLISGHTCVSVANSFALVTLEWGWTISLKAWHFRNHYFIGEGFVRATNGCLFWVKTHFRASCLVSFCTRMKVFVVLWQRNSLHLSLPQQLVYCPQKQTNWRYFFSNFVLGQDTKGFLQKVCSAHHSAIAIRTWNSLKIDRQPVKPNNEGYNAVK